MKKKAPNEYDDSNPWQGDQLERKSVGAYLTDLISSIEQPFVIALKSEFGTGKTDFLERWKRHLNQDKRPISAVYFNAWETDYALDPLVALIDRILPEINDQSGSLMTALDSMAMYSLSLGLQSLSEIVDPTGISKKVATVIKAGSQDRIDEKKYGQFKTRLDEFKSTQKAIKIFRDTLSTAVKGPNQNGPKLVILIDELDRCRPTYAIEVLECVKHLFNTPGVIFVIAVDDDQLRNAVSSVYGPNLDGDGYLRKFFDWQLNLPKPSAEQYTRYLIDKFNLSSYFEEDSNLSNCLYANFNSKEAFIKIFSVFSEIFGLSLRKQEQCFTTLDLVLRDLQNYKNIMSPYLGFLLAVYAHKIDKREFERFCSGKVTSTDDDLCMPNPASRERSVLSNLANRDLVESTFNKTGLKYEDFRQYLFMDLHAIKKQQAGIQDRQVSSNMSITQKEVDQLNYRYSVLKSIEDVLKSLPNKQVTVAGFLYGKIEGASSLLDSAR